MVQEYIERYLTPRIQGDGGWVEFVEQDGDRVKLIFRGECSKCLILNRCVAWIEEMIARDLQQTVHIEAVRRKPYFQDV